MSSGRIGAYGFAFQNMEAAGEWLNEVPPSWPTVTLRQSSDVATSVTQIGSETADIALLGGRSVQVRNIDPEICFNGPTELTSAALIHPYLAPAAAILAHWRGWNTLHAGGFEADGHVWLVTADRNGGKSTTLAAMAEMGYRIVSDDLMVLRDGVALAGPRSLDLREQGDFHGVDDFGIVGERRRWRKWLPPISPEVAVAGIIKLKWSDWSGIRAVAAEDRAPILQSALSMPTERRGMLGLLSMPMFEVSRPSGPLKDTVDLVASMRHRLVEYGTRRILA